MSGSRQLHSDSIRRSCALAFLVIAALPGTATAHWDGPPVTPTTIWRAWNLDPTILISLTLAAWIYWRGVYALWQRAGADQGVRRWQTAAFTGGLAVVFVALVTPLDALSSALFSAHMVQHLLLILVAAPLLVLGAPLIGLVWGLPQPWRRHVARWQHQALPRPVRRTLTQPVAALALHAAAIWAWHVPTLYEAALRSALVHSIEHLSFLGTALLFWWVLIHSCARGQVGFGASVLYVFVTAMQGGVLGALITFARNPWYPAHTDGAAAWGITPLEDQQLAGLIMWIPAGMIYLFAGLLLFAAWLRSVDRNMARKERLTMELGEGLREGA